MTAVPLSATWGCARQHTTLLSGKLAYRNGTHRVALWLRDLANDYPSSTTAYGRSIIDENVTLIIRHGIGGHNPVSRALTQPGQYNELARGTTMLILMEMTGLWPLISYKLSFKTSGCGGILRDTCFFANPGYPKRIEAGDMCVWLYRSTQSRVQFELIKINVSPLDQFTD
ncbi:unnamed protein product [Echinostoma caproni]|uniref:CUB domain-containing protein n=1 Tax=Echinostoma caproni TaxID=27848 RepID=A0A183AX01_9TREM|nr:unnamed protein product [Echinostoma caproni]